MTATHEEATIEFYIKPGLTRDYPAGAQLVAVENGQEIPVRLVWAHRKGETRILAIPERL